MSTRPFFADLAVPSVVAQGTPFDVSNYSDKWIQLGGTWAATVEVRGSINGTDYELVHSTTQKDTVELPALYQFIRVDLTAYTSGTVRATFAGRDER